MEVAEERVALPDGREIDGFLSVRTRDFVAIVAVTEQDEFVLIRSYKHGPRTISLAVPEERTLALKLCQFAETVPAVLNDFRPNLLANYLYELANAFHTFYEACPVLKSEEPLRSSRLALCELTGRVLAKGLDLLGIKVPEKM